jgi:hypothetical protein
MGKSQAINRAWEKWPRADIELVAELVSAGWDAAALEAVTVPTENEREALSLIISNAVGGGNPNVRAITDVTDAVIAAGFRLPVPVEPEQGEN